MSALFASTLRGYSAAEAKPKVVLPTAPLAGLLPGPGQETVSDPSFIVRAAALVQPDKHVLKQLLRVRPQDEEGPQLRIGGVRSARAASESLLQAVTARHATTVAGAASTAASGGGDAAGWSFSDGHGTDGGEIPAVVINNAILRQHFRQLTFSFLRPFDKYFHIDPRWRPCSGVGGDVANTRAGPGSAAEPLGRGQPILAPARLQGVGAGNANLRERGPTAPAHAAGAAAAGANDVRTYGPYDDLPAMLLPRFSEQEFLEELQRAGGPRHKLLRAAKWRELYSAFIHSPHFHPWFQARRRECARHMFDMARVLRLAMKREDLLASAGALDFTFAVSPDVAGLRRSTSDSGASEAGNRSCGSNTSGTGSVIGAQTTGRIGGSQVQLLAPARIGSAASGSTPSPAASPLPPPLAAAGQGAGSTLPPAAAPAAGGASPLLRVVGRGMPHTAVLAPGKLGGLAPRPALGVPPLALSRAASVSSSPAGTPAASQAGTNATASGAPGDGAATPSDVPAPAPAAGPSSSTPAIVGSAAALTLPVAAPPMRALTSQQLQRHEAACLELHGKIRACLDRERAFLEHEPALAVRMRDHLAAVESVMPPRLLHSIAAQVGAAVGGGDVVAVAAGRPGDFAARRAPAAEPSDVLQRHA